MVRVIGQVLCRSAPFSFFFAVAPRLSPANNPSAPVGARGLGVTSVDCSPSQFHFRCSMLKSRIRPPEEFPRLSCLPQSRRHYLPPGEGEDNDVCRDIEGLSISCRLLRRPCAHRLYEVKAMIVKSGEGALTSFLLLAHHSGDLLLVALHLAAGLGVLGLLRGGTTRVRRQQGCTGGCLVFSPAVAAAREGRAGPLQRPAHWAVKSLGVGPGK
ncbi:hypothetical protein FJTKL_00688 [Diaporthe vaccinii]|uniref:Uncharacterized protein n=1 Tax=Diaporthe vaccinii TaxID=105482 RepID=A0ABR4F679_9PEZI